MREEILRIRGTAMSLLEEALKYLNKYKFSVIPIRQGSKKPYIDWKEYQKRLPIEEEIKKWWSQWPRANIGIITGQISGITVIDLDNPEALGYAKKQGLPLTPLVKTGKGFHPYFRYEEGVGNFQKRDDLPGIDLRGDGGYVIAPPSIHVSGKQYKWIEGKTLDDVPLATLPEWVLAHKPEDKTPIKDLYRGVSAGDRNNALTRIAGSLVNDGLPLEECIKIAKAWNTLNKPPLPLKEVETTVKSIYEKHHREKNNEYVQTVEAVEAVEDTAYKLFPITEFPLNVFPEDLRRLMLRVSGAFNVPVGAVASAMLPIISSAIGNSVRIKVKNSWLEPPFIWLMLIGRSGSGKSPLINKLLKFIQARQAEEFSLYEKERLKYEKSLLEHKIKIKKIEKKSKDNSIDLPLGPPKPVLTHYVVSDTTIEALANVMASSPRGVLIHSDELSGFIRSHDQYKIKGSDRQKYLEVWNCEPWKIDRVKEGSKYIRDTGCAIVGGIQSQVMPQIFGFESFIDGLLPRFLMSIIHNSHSGISDEEITDTDMNVFKGILEKCYNINLFKDEKGNNEYTLINFDSEAKYKFLEFQKDYLEKSHFLPDRAQVFIPKLISYAVRLSGIFHIIYGEDTNIISSNTVSNSIRLIHYFVGQAMQALKFYDKTKKLEEIEVELVRSLYELEGQVMKGRLKTDIITTHLNKKLPKSIKQSNQGVGYMLRKVGLTTKLSVGHSYLIWEPLKLKKLFFLYVDTSTASTASTDKEKIEDELLG